MRILFFIEPLVEREDPTWKSGWIDYFVNKISTALLAEGIAEEDIACLVPTALEANARKVLPTSRVVSIDQTELVPRFGGSALEIASGWYKRIASKHAIVDMASLVKERLGDFVPTCCITFSPAPYLNISWPNANVLHMEYGFISRPPFPETVYFDPNGMFSDSAIAHFSIELRQRIPGVDELALLRDVRERFCRFDSSQMNPLAKMMPELLVKYESAVLLALQFSNFYAYDANARFADQYDLLVHTLESLPPNVGVVVCEHPEHPVLKPKTVEYLRSRYPNFVWDPLFRLVNAVSHYLMPYVQGVVTVSSSVGLQALLWKKKLAVLGGGHLSSLCDTNDVSSLMPLTSGGGSVEKDRLLCWILSNYHLPLEAMITSGRLTNYFKSIRVGKKDSFDEATLGLGLDLPKLREFYDSAWNKRPLSAYPNKNDFNSKGFYAALYVATEGRYYDERCCLRQFVNELDGKEVCLNFILDGENDNPLGLRFDPTNRPGLIQMNELALLDANDVVLWKWDELNSGICTSQGMVIFDKDEGKLLVCYNDDPQIELNIDFSLFEQALHPLVVRARLSSANLCAVEVALSERDGQIVKLSHAVKQGEGQIVKLSHAVKERDEQIVKLSQTVGAMDGQIELLCSTLADRDATIQNILNSYSWRLT